MPTLPAPACYPTPALEAMRRETLALLRLSILAGHRRPAEYLDAIGLLERHRGNPAALWPVLRACVESLGEDAEDIDRAFAPGGGGQAAMKNFDASKLDRSAIMDLLND